MKLKALLPLLTGVLSLSLITARVSGSFDKFFIPDAPVALDPLRALNCSEDGNKPLPWFSKDEGRTFTLRDHEWRTTTFTWVGANLDRHNITSDKGTEFHYQDHRNGGGFTLTSLNDTKVIQCEPV